MTVRNMNLVAPLAQKATAMHTTETAGKRSGRSGVVSPLIGQIGLLWGDVDSANKRPLSRTSTTVTRTTTTSTTNTVRWPSAESLDYSFDLLLQAYLDCRKKKRGTNSAQAFEQNLEANLWSLHLELIGQTYRPGRSICFVITRPKPREVWAAEFRDRIVHHLLYNRISKHFLRRFIYDSCACIEKRGTLFGDIRLEKKARSITQNWTCSAFYLKCDLANFFVSIDKSVLWPLIQSGTPEGWWQWLAHTVVWHDPTENYIYQGDPALLDLVPPHKRLTNQAKGFGLAIGNHSSQFEANVLLNVLDQFIKHKIGAKHYIRYVDDFIILHESAQWLNDALAQIETFLPERLNLRLNPKKTILQPLQRGADFVGQVIKPHHRVIRRRTFKAAIQGCKTVAPEDLHATANSYLGLMRHSSSHGYRAAICNVARKRGHSVAMDITKIYKKATNKTGKLNAGFNRIEVENE